MHINILSLSLSLSLSVYTAFYGEICNYVLGYFIYR